MSPRKSIVSAAAVFLTVFAPMVAIAQVAATPSVIPQVATPPVVPATQPTTASGEDAEYILGAEDTIEVGIVGSADKIRARIYTDGTFQMNLIGKVTAAGRTPRQLATEIADALKKGGYYANPIVDVEVTGYASRYVTVLGAFNQPGLVPINRAYHLSEILARVGGVREGAADYLIVRPENGPEKRYIVERLAAGDPSEDPLVAAGDKIFAPPAEVFYVLGQVKSPGTYPIKADQTIAQAIARAGGVTESGSDKKVKVQRGGKTTKMDNSEKVLPGDVLTITERLF